MNHSTLDLIAVVRHPDDVEIACGGTLARLADLGYRVGIVDLTDGEPTPGCPDPAARQAEAQAAAKVLGVAVRETLHFPNRYLFDSVESRVALATLFALPATDGPGFRRQNTAGLARPCGRRGHYRCGRILQSPDQGR